MTLPGSTLFVLVWPVLLLAVFAYVMYLVVRAGVRAGMRDHALEFGATRPPDGPQPLPDGHPPPDRPGPQ